MPAQFFALLAVLIIPARIVGLVIRWARWLPRHTAAPSSVTRTAHVMLVAGGIVTFATPLAVRVHHVFFGRMRCPPTTLPGRVYELLSAGMSDAVRYGAYCGVGTVVLTALWLLYATWRWHWRVRPPDVPRDPPYR